MYWPHFFKFNSMRFVVMLFIFVLLPFPGFVKAQVGETNSIPPIPIYADHFTVSLGPEPTRGMIVLIGETLGNKHPHPGWIFILSALLLLIKVALSFMAAALIFYYDSHKLTEEKKIRF